MPDRGSQTPESIRGAVVNGVTSPVGKSRATSRNSGDSWHHTVSPMRSADIEKIDRTMIGLQ
ncbi:hypothetical protein ACQEVZ_11000 [Dactylosporangium sp. CA-152071]|uniref:hypothetical protein n=1 Tax=Dactylosporangium sp. CA-152071 TaxID=3239933 RepID=UPI003D8FCE8A